MLNNKILLRSPKSTYFELWISVLKSWHNPKPQTLKAMVYPYLVEPVLGALIGTKKI